MATRREDASAGAAGAGGGAVVFLPPDKYSKRYGSQFFTCELTARAGFTATGECLRETLVGEEDAASAAGGGGVRTAELSGVTSGAAEYVAFAVRVHMGDQCWTLWRRYSEFDTLRAAIARVFGEENSKRGFGGDGAGAQEEPGERGADGKPKRVPGSMLVLAEFPPKTMLWSVLDTRDEFIQERYDGLQEFLQQGLQQTPACAADRTVRDFLELDLDHSEPPPGGHEDEPPPPPPPPPPENANA